MSDSCGVRAHALADWRLQPAPKITRPICLASLISGTIRPATCGRRALRFCFMISKELAMLLLGYSANLAGQACMASTRAGDRNRATSLMMFPLARRTFCGRSSRAAPGIEPGTCPALSENHTTKPSSQMSITSTAAFSRGTSPTQPFVPSNTYKRKRTTARGFEHLQEEPNGFRFHLLCHSDTLSC